MASKPSRVPALILKSIDPEINKITPITSSPFVIGRGAEATFKLRHKFVSRKQCVIEKSGINWSITSQGSRFTSLNNIPLLVDNPTSLNCSDVIEIPGGVKFEFKCSPDPNGRCCETIEILSPTWLLNDSSDFAYTSVPRPSALNAYQDSLSTEKLSADSSVYVVDEIRPVSADNPVNMNFKSTERGSIKPSSAGSSNLGLLLKIDRLTEMILMYANHLERNESLESVNNHSRLTDELNLRLKCAESIDEYCIDESCDAHEINGDIDKLIEVMKKLSSILDKKREDIISSPGGVIGDDITVNVERIFLAVDIMLMNKVKAIVNALDKLPNGSIANKSNQYSTSNMSYKPSIVCRCKQRTRKIANRKREAPSSAGVENLDGYESDLKKNVEWREAKIKLLEMKLKEKEVLGNELENAKEENDRLVNKISEMKRTLADKEVMELEFKYLQESVKYKEEDKRSKDLLQERITSQENDITCLKTKNEKLLADIEQMKNENAELKEKNKTLEEKLNEKRSTSMASGACKGDNADGEFCCDAVREVKSSLIELLEREFNCSICGEIFIEPTVTNCNHVFCSFCLNEWKKMKRECPFCRTIIVKECKALIIDEYVSSFLKLISEKMLPERLRLIQERKAPPSESPAAKRPRASSRGRRAVTPRRGRNQRAQVPQNPHVNPIDPISGFPENFLEDMALRIYLMRPGYNA